MDKKVFLAVALSVAIFMIWQTLYLKPRQQQQATQMTQQETVPPAPTQTQPGVSATVGSSSPEAPSSAQTVRIGSPAFMVEVDTKGGTVGSISIPEYRGTKTDDFAWLIGGKGQGRITTPSPEWAYLSNVKYSVVSQGKNAEGKDQLVLSYEDENASIRRTYTIRPEIYSVDHQLAVNFKKQSPNYLFVGIQALREIPKEKSENERREILFHKSGGQEKWAIDGIDAGEVEEDLGQGQWAGLASRYFLNALVDQGSANPQFQARNLQNGEVVANLIYRVSSQSVQLPVRQYYGPKDIDVLKAAGKKLDAAVDFGWFTVFAYPLLQLLKWFHKYVDNFGIAIILLTLVVKILTYPLTLKSMKGMKEMQRIQPQLAALRERYKDDKEKLNKEMLQLMRTNGYNPMSGCLPIFIQMPIFIALYNVLYGTIDLVGEPFFGWITDLSSKDPFYVTPVLLGLMMFVQQKLTPNTATDPAQQRMMMMMPVIFGVMMLWLPSGLTLYMLVNSVISVAQQLWMNRKLGLGRPATA